MTASGTAAAPEYADFESDTRTAAESFFNRLGVIALIALAPATILYLSFNQGGYFPNSTGLAAIALAAGLVARTTLAEHPFEGYNRRLAVLLLALAAFAALQLASALWSHDTALALDEYDRTLLYLLAFALFGSLPRSPERLRWLIRALAIGMTAVCMAGLISRVLPHVWTTSDLFAPNRLNYPLTYWNAEGLLAAIATLLLVHLAASEDEHPSVRVLGAIFVPATAATLLFTFSRGAIGVAIIGVIAYLVLARPRGAVGAAVALIPTTAISLHAAYAAQLLASHTPTSPGAVTQGHHVALTVALCMLGAGGLRLAMLWPDRWLAGSLERVRGPKLPPRAIALGAGLVVAVALLVLGLSGVIGREWRQFAHGSVAGQTVTRSRLGSIQGSGRVRLWRIALDAFGERPLLGYGAGTYQLYYAQHRPTESAVRDAHDLYVQTLAELGIVGFVLLALVIFGVLALLAIRIRGPDRATYAVLFAAALAWAIHSGVDWDWQMPAVTLWLFIAAGAALASAQPPSGLRPGLPSNRTLVAIGWLVLAVAPLLIGVSYQRLRASGAELTSGNCVRARQDAFSSISLLPDRPEAYEVISDCDLELGFPLQGLQAARKAVHYGQNDWNYQYGLAIALAENGIDPIPAARKALRLNPREGIIHDELVAFTSGGRSAWEGLAPGVLAEGLQSEQLAITNL